MYHVIGVGHVTNACLSNSSTPNEKFYDFNKIRAEIVPDTEDKTGRNAGISPMPINLPIFSPNVLTLTLVDLPGLTKLPVGDQCKDIEEQIRDMLFKCISKPASVLVVTPATTDLANSDGFNMAYCHGPGGFSSQQTPQPPHGSPVCVIHAVRLAKFSNQPCADFQALVVVHRSRQGIDQGP